MAILQLCLVISGAYTQTTPGGGTTTLSQTPHAVMDAPPYPPLGRQLAATTASLPWAVSTGSGSARAAAAHAGGSTVVTGYFSGTATFGAAGSLTSAGSSDGFVAKLDSAGAFLWAVRFGGSGSDYGYGFAAQADEIGRAHV